MGSALEDFTLSAQREPGHPSAGARLSRAMIATGPRRPAPGARPSCWSPGGGRPTQGSLWRRSGGAGCGPSSLTPRRFPSGFLHFQAAAHIRRWTPPRYLLIVQVRGPHTGGGHSNTSRIRARTGATSSCSAAPKVRGGLGTGQPVRGPDRLGQGPQTAMPWSPRATSIASISSVSLGRLPSGITRCGPSRSAQPTD